MSAMKNLGLALEELRQAESNLLAAAGWRWVIGDSYVSPSGVQLSHEKAVQQIKQRWGKKLSS